MRHKSKRRLLIGLLVLFEVVVLSAIAYAVATPVLGIGRGMEGKGIGSRAQVEEALSPKVTSTADPSRLRIINPLGRVEVRGSANNESITVEGKKQARGWNRAAAQSVMDKTEVHVEERNEEVFVRVSYPESRPLWGLLGGFTTVDLVISVPEDIRMDAEANMGEIRTSGIAGHVTLKSNMGAIFAENMRGDLTTHTNMGMVKVDDFEGNLSAESNMGAVKVRNARIDGRLQLKTNMGEVDFHGTPGQRTEMTSNSGRVRIGMPSDQAFEIDARTDLGSINIQVPFDGVHDHRRAEGVVGKGDPQGTLSLRANLGSIEIEEER